MRRATLAIAGLYAFSVLVVCLDSKAHAQVPMGAPTGGMTFGGGGTGTGGGVTNSAGANVVTKSDGTNLVASTITDDGSIVTTTKRITSKGVATGGFGAVVVSHAFTCDWTLGSNCTATLQGGGADVLTLSNPIIGTTYRLLLIQPAGTDGTVTWPASIHWVGNTAPTLTTTDDRLDMITCYYAYDTVYYCKADLNFVA